MALSVVHMLVIVCVAAAIWTVQGKGEYCCSPDQFTVTIAQLNGLALPGGQGLLQYNNVSLAADYSNMRIGEEILSTINDQTTKIQVIIDFAKNVMYTIVDGNCYKTPAKGFFQQCIPKVARFDGSYSVGENQLTVNTYSFFISVSGYMDGAITSTVTQGGCIPFSSTFAGQTMETGFPIPVLSTSDYVNFERGISDPGHWFNIPVICQQSIKPEKFNASTEYLNEATKLVSMLNAMLPIFSNQ